MAGAGQQFALAQKLEVPKIAKKEDLDAWSWQLDGKLNSVGLAVRFHAVVAVTGRTGMVNVSGIWLSRGLSN